MEMIALIILIVPGIITGVIADSIAARKNQNGFWWGFFLSILGIIVVALMPEGQIVDNYQNSSNIWKLEKIQKLRESKEITELEFIKEKESILGKKSKEGFSNIILVYIVLIALIIFGFFGASVTNPIETNKILLMIMLSISCMMAIIIIMLIRRINKNNKVSNHNRYFNCLLELQKLKDINMITNAEFEQEKFQLKRKYNQ